MATAPPRRRRLRIGVVVAGAVGLVLVGFNSWAWTQLKPQPLASTAPASGTTLSATSCEPCHVEIAAEWRTSRMARTATSPVFLAEVAHQGQDPFVCQRCHAPLPEQQEEVAFGLAWFKPLTPLTRANSAFDPTLAEEGVTCTVCHLSPDGLRGAANTAQAPHPVVPTTPADMNQTCARCHQLAAPPLSNLKRPITDTVAEWQRWQQQTGRSESCVDCHMPSVQRPLMAGMPVRTGHRHHFPGAWHDGFAASGLRITAPQRTPEGVQLTLENLAGHRLPSGEPLRALVIEARAAGKISHHVIAREVDGYRDVRYNTLLPGEVRTVTLSSPGPGAVDLSIHLDRLYFSPELQAVAPDHVVELARYRLP